MQFRKKYKGEKRVYNVAVVNNNMRYNLRLPWRKKETNSSQFLTRIPSHPRKKLTDNENKSVTVYEKWKNNLQYSDHVFQTPFSDTWMK